MVNIHVACKQNKMEASYEIMESFNQEFCELLEYHLCATFRNSDQKEISKLWCDGIVCNHFSKKLVNDKREIKTIAWIGENGQYEFEMNIKFGKHSLRRYAKGTKIIDCIPDSDSINWIEIDLEKNSFKFNLSRQMKVYELEEIFERLIDKLKFEIGNDSEILTETDAYRLIPTENWNKFDKPEDWNTASEIDLGSLKDDIEELEKLARSKERICTYVDFDRLASLLREISHMNNPID